MKVITINDVEATVVSLVAQGRSVNNLKVKHALRDQGFYATRSEVSAYMDDLVQAGKLEFTSNGFWRTYYLLTTAPSKVKAMGFYGGVSRSRKTITKCKGSNSNILVSAASYTKRDGKEITSTDASNAKYKVTNSTYDMPMYFPVGFTRDEVRQAYAKIKGIHFNDTRVATIAKY
jgi:hypothetical protein